MSTEVIEHIVNEKTDLKVNELFPVFLKPKDFRILLVGGGYVAQEKITALLGNSPKANVTVVAKKFIEVDGISPIKDFAKDFPNVSLIEKPFSEADLDNIQLLIVAIDDKLESERIKSIAAAHGILTNVADTPALCDFYLGSIVQKGQLKIAISTNGASPTLAKRLKEVLNETIPMEINQSIDHLVDIRKTLSGNFQEKVQQLNKITSVLSLEQPKAFPLWKSISLYSIVAIGLMLTGHILFSFLPLSTIGSWIYTTANQVDGDMVYFILGGFVAQMIDGSLSMAYGVSAATLLAVFGVPPAATSASVHTAEIFTSGVSGLMHLKFGNVNNKLFKILLLPGILGAILGAYLLSSLEVYMIYLKPVVAGYTLFLGILIIRKVVKRKVERKPVKRVAGLAVIGGFLDSIGGGGWGPIVASTLIARGRNPMYTVGSVCLAEFFVSLASSITFITLIGLSHWQIIVGLILGGVVAAPIAARLPQKLPVKSLMLVVGIVVIALSLRNLFNVIVA